MPNVLSAIHLAPNRMIRMAELCQRGGFSRATGWRLVNTDPDFPRPIRLSAGITGFDETEFNAWLKAKAQASARSR